MHPLLRLVTAVEPEDWVALLPPFAFVHAARLALGDREETDQPARIEARDPAFIERILDGVRWVGERWFRHRALGLDHVPATGPGLLVGNHSGGMMIFDGLLTNVSLWDHFGPERALYSLGHDVLQWHPVIRRYAERFGGIPAGHTNAARVFAAGHLALVYPGSDFDSFRPFSQRDRVVLAGRTGFVQLALRQQVPVIPVVTAGAHEAYVVLTRGEGIARLLQLKERLRTNAFPIVLSFPWGLTTGYLPYLPLPTPITTSFLPPIRWDHLGPEAADDEETVQRCYREVEAALQTELSRLYRGRVPWLGRL